MKIVKFIIYTAIASFNCSFKTVGMEELELGMEELSNKGVVPN